MVLLHINRKQSERNLMTDSRSVILQFGSAWRLSASQWHSRTVSQYACDCATVTHYSHIQLCEGCRSVARKVMRGASMTWGFLCVLCTGKYFQKSGALGITPGSLQFHTVDLLFFQTQTGSLAHLSGFPLSTLTSWQ